MKTKLATPLLLLLAMPTYAASTLTLTWDKNTDRVDGYTVHTSLPGIAKVTKLATVSNTAKNVNEKNKMFFSTPINTLVLDSKNGVCFRLKAFNPAGSSEFSDEACTTIGAEIPQNLSISVTVTVTVTP